MRAREPVLVVGAGVSGLSCAIRLLERGHPVRVWTRDDPADTVSAVAGAFWLPYRAQPLERVLAWAATGYRELAALAADPATGVRMRDGLEVGTAPGEPPWVPASGAEFRAATPSELPPGHARGVRFRVPVADMPVYLPWLMSRVAALGGTIERRAIASLAEALAESAVVVNCTGLGARELCADGELVAVRGQLVLVERGASAEILLDEDAPGGPAYVVPRGADCVLGGTAEEGREDLAVDSAQIDAIRARCERLAPELAGRAVRAVRVGLRPVRSSVRLEAERPAPGQLLVHDYGHGGAGVTLSWGCAAEVADLVRTATAEDSR